MNSLLVSMSNLGAKIFRWEQRPPMSFYPMASADCYQLKRIMSLNWLSLIFRCTIAVVPAGVFLSFFPTFAQMQTNMRLQDRRDGGEIRKRMIRISISLLLLLGMKDLVLEAWSLLRPFTSSCHQITASTALSGCLVRGQ